jgi:hypothetical protein
MDRGKARGMSRKPDVVGAQMLETQPRGALRGAVVVACICLQADKQSFTAIPDFQISKPVYFGGDRRVSTISLLIGRSTETRWEALL